jgi:hypothetical protein
MELDAEECDLLLTAVFHLRIDHAEDIEKGARIEALVVKLGGDPEAVFFGGYVEFRRRCTRGRRHRRAPLDRVHL